MPSADAEATEETPVDQARDSLLDALSAELGDALVASHRVPGRDLWIRLDTAAWGDAADYLRNRQRFRFFEWLSAIDWLPSPFGRSHGAVVDEVDTDDTSDGDDAEAAGPVTGANGFTGGDTRFQVFARVYSLTTGIGLTVKADLGDDLTVGTWTGSYPGADWHEREANEMFGITFAGHPGLRNLYLPTDFEGHPMRKDYPLMARLVKPWPGIVDVEPMPEAEEGEPTTGSPDPTAPPDVKGVGTEGPGGS